MAETVAERVWFRLARLHTRGFSTMSDHLRSIGLSVPQCDVLATLTEREGITQQELAKRLYVTKGNISGLIDRLAKAGLVVRKQSQEDKRTRCLYLTAEGRRLAAAGVDLQQKLVSEAFSSLDTETLLQLEAGIITMRDGIRKIASPNGTLQNRNTDRKFESTGASRE